MTAIQRKKQQLAAFIFASGVFIRLSQS